MQIKDIMTKNVKYLSVDSPITEAAKMMLDGDFGCVPVEENDRLVGMITDRDITLKVVAAGKDYKKTKVKDCMSQGIEYCFQEDSLEEVCNRMAETQYRRMPILNGQKRLVGIVSLGDLALAEDGLSSTHEALKGIISGDASEQWYEAV